MVVGGGLDVELGDEREVILELLVAFLKCFLNLYGQGMTHYVELVFGDEVDNGAIYSVVDYVAGHLLAETTLEFTEGHVAFAETGYCMGAANLLDFLGHFVLIVILCDGYRETKLHGREFFL